MTYILLYTSLLIRQVVINLYSLFGCLSERKAPGYQKEVCLYEFLLP